MAPTWHAGNVSETIVRNRATERPTTPTSGRFGVAQLRQQLAGALHVEVSFTGALEGTPTDV
jgi:hypothetical protein